MYGLSPLEVQCVRSQRHWERKKENLESWLSCVCGLYISRTSWG